MNLMPNRSVMAAYLVSGFLLGVPIGVIITSQCSSDSEFVEIKLMQIIQLFVTLVIAVFFTYVINTMVNRNLRRMDAIIELIKNFQEEISRVFVLGSSYMINPDIEKERAVMSALKTGSVFLGIIYGLKEEAVGKNIIDHDSLLRNFWKFKKAISDTPFGEKSPVYSAKARANFENTYKRIMGMIFRSKLKVYS